MWFKNIPYGIDKSNASSGLSASFLLLAAPGINDSEYPNDFLASAVMVFWKSCMSFVLVFQSGKEPVKIFLSWLVLALYKPSNVIKWSNTYETFAGIIVSSTS